MGTRLGKKGAQLECEYAFRSVYQLGRMGICHNVPRYESNHRACW